MSSRIVTTLLKLARAGQRIPGGSRESSYIFVTVLSVYAPTLKAPPQVKQRFVEDLQDTVDRVPASDVMVMLGDFHSCQV